jgi:hypothetical protein
MTPGSAEAEPRLADLFRETGRAHHQAFLATDGEDPEWPIWYAGHLQASLGAVLGGSLTRSEIVHALIEADRMHREQAAGEDWPRFYARVFLDRFGRRATG